MIVLSLEIGTVVEGLQRERDAVTLYLSDLGPSTRGFLRARFDATDEAIANMRIWPTDFDDMTFNESGASHARLVEVSSGRKSRFEIQFVFFSIATKMTA